MRKLTPPKKRPEVKKDDYEIYWDQRPSLNFSEKEIPECKDWEVGDSQTIVAKIIVERKSKEVNADTQVTLRVVSIGLDTDNDDK